VRVLVVGEVPLARGGLGVLLAAETGLELVGQVSPAEAVGAVASHLPQVVVWDLGVRPRGTEGIGRVARAEVGPAVVALVPDGETAAEALAAGARGVLLREIEVKRMAAAIVSAAWGLTVLEGTLAGELLRPPSPPLADLAEPLTPREVEVLQLVAAGRMNAEIARDLFLSVRSV